MADFFDYTQTPKPLSQSTCRDRRLNASGLICVDMNLQVRREHQQILLDCQQFLWGRLLCAQFPAKSCYFEQSLTKDYPGSTTMRQHVSCPVDLKIRSGRLSRILGTD